MIRKSLLWKALLLGLMSNDSLKRENRALRSLSIALGILLVLNPFTLYLVGAGLMFSVLTPIAFAVVAVWLDGIKLNSHYLLLGFNLLFVSSLFIHAEVIFTYCFSEYIIDDLYETKGNYYFNRPYLDKTFRDKEFTVRYKTNKQGFRIGVEDDPESTVDMVDWIFLGDSYTQGAQVEYEELYTTKLFEYFPDKVIINAGISGMGLPDEYAYYCNDGKELHPKKVFLQICNFNDFMNVIERKSGFSDYLMQESNLARHILYGFKFANPAELPLGRWTEPFYPEEQSNRDFNVFYKPSSVQKQRDLLKFEAYLLAINDEVKNSGAELVVIQIPTKEQVNYRYFEEVVNSFDIDISNLDMSFPNRFVKEICESNGIKHLDLFDDFTDTVDRLFYDYDEHLNSRGHTVLAASLSRFLNKHDDRPNGAEFLSCLNVGDRYPNVSQNDCQTLSYQSMRDGNMELFIGDKDLRSQKRLTWNNVDEIHPALSPDKSLLAFTEGNQEELTTEIVVMNIDGTDRMYITSDDNLYGAIPSFSHDGTSVTYAEWSYDPSTERMSNPYLVVVELKSGKKTVVTSDQVESWRPIFSQNDSALYFISKKNGQFDVFVKQLASGQLKNLTNTDYDEWDPTLSSKNDLLVYAGFKFGNWDLFVKDLISGETRQITKTLGDEWDPAFSSCDSSIYYAGVFGLRNGIFRLSYFE